MENRLHFIKCAVLAEAHYGKFFFCLRYVCPKMFSAVTVTSYGNDGPAKFLIQHEDIFGRSQSGNSITVAGCIYLDSLSIRDYMLSSPYSFCKPDISSAYFG